ncbi:hypothetical protein D9M71_823700 [compost metagenome]
MLEVLEQEDTLQLHVAVAHFDIPVRDFANQLCQLVIADFRRVGAAGFAVGLVQGVHVVFSSSSCYRQGRSGSDLGWKLRCVQAQLHGFVNHAHDVFVGQVEQALHVR